MQLGLAIEMSEKGSRVRLLEEKHLNFAGFEHLFPWARLLVEVNVWHQDDMCPTVT